MVFFLIPMFTSYPKQSSTIPMSMKYFLYSYIWLLLLTDMKILFHKCLCSKRKKTNCTFDKHIEILRLDCSKTINYFLSYNCSPQIFGKGANTVYPQLKYSSVLLTLMHKHVERHLITCIELPFFYHR